VRGAKSYNHKKAWSSIISQSPMGMVAVCKPTSIYTGVSCNSNGCLPKAVLCNNACSTRNKTSSIMLLHVPCGGIFKQSMGVRNQVRIGLSYRPARLHTTQPGGIVSMESILGLLKSLKIRALTPRYP
jgi:hypothetical protein